MLSDSSQQGCRVYTGGRWGSLGWCLTRLKITYKSMVTMKIIPLKHKWIIHFPFFGFIEHHGFGCHRLHKKIKKKKEFLLNAWQFLYIWPFPAYINVKVNVQQSDRHVHSCLELVILIKTSIYNPSQKSVVLESSVKPRQSSPALVWQKFQKPMTFVAGLSSRGLMMRY